MTPEELFGHLFALEQELLRPEIRTSPGALESLLVEDFLEFGGSGRVFDRAAIVHALAVEPNSKSIQLEGFTVLTSAENLAVVTYRSVTRDNPQQPPHRSLRSSIWVRRNGRWQMRFHQGTREPS